MSASPTISASQPLPFDARGALPGTRACVRPAEAPVHFPTRCFRCSLLPRARGRGSAVPDWRDPLPRAPGPVTSRLTCLGLTQCRGLGRWGGTAWLRMADAAPIPAAPQAVGAGRVLLEDLLAVMSTERFPTLGLALSPRNPKDRRPSTGSLALPGHSCHLLRPNRGGKTPIPLREELRPYGSSSPGSPLHCRPVPPAPGMHRCAPKANPTR
jgi:hypothetical protein